MKQYRISRVAGEIDWSEIEALSVDQWQWQPPMEIRMEAKLCHDGQYLHVRLCAWEGTIRAEHTHALAMVCEDSCMEFFLRPEEGDLRYFNFEINPNAAMFIGFGRGREELVRLLPPECAVGGRHAERTQDGWIAQYRISADFVRLFFPDFALERGKRLRANCYKCAQKGETPHYITWNRVSSDAPSFHRPEDFGVMILE